MALILPIALYLASGFAVVLFGWPGGRRRDDLLMQLFLAAGIGVGICSLNFAILRFIGVSWFLSAKLLPLVLCVIVVLLRHPGKRTADFSRNDIELPPWLQRTLFCAAAFSVFAALHSIMRRVAAHPHGASWDAFAIWNLHARFLFLGGPSWRSGFTALIPWSHPDYPLLVPAAIGQFWSYLGSDTPSVPAAISVVFAFATCGLLFSSLLRLRGPNAAILGTLALASTPLFVELAAAQCADIPLSFFFLATITLLCLFDGAGTGASGLVALAGFSAGFAAWTKNEGLLFMAAVVLGNFLAFARGKAPFSRQALHRIALILAGSVPVLLVCFWFKHFVAPPGDLFSDSASMTSKVLDPKRYWIILNWFGKELLRFGEWWIVPGTVLLGILHVMSAGEGPQGKLAGRRASIWILGLTLMGYFAIYVITPRELHWHLRFSLNRLFLQVWPSVLFLFFSSISFRFLDTVSK